MYQAHNKARLAFTRVQRSVRSFSFCSGTPCGFVSRSFQGCAIKESFKILSDEYDIIIIEGAGSPAEINMRDQDIANMEIAHLADANVILIADIEMGGVFAAIAGTYVLLDDYDRSRLKATVINKFRGNLDILKPGLDRIEEITGEPVLGVLPYDETLKLPEEDSASQIGRAHV